MRNIRELGFDSSLVNNVKEKGTPLLGICLGMQMLGNFSTEHGYCEGMGFIDCAVERFDLKLARMSRVKVPHVGFNTVSVDDGSTLFSGFRDSVDFYFTHSYRMVCNDTDLVVGSCWHGEDFVAAVQKENIYGTQFHPEKSQNNGLKLLKNFVESA